MSRLRTLFTALVLALVLAAVPVPSEAATARREDPSSARLSLLDFVPQWIVSLFEKIGWHIDPNGSGGTSTTDGEEGDIGWGIDPNG